ncbi:MAG TPA: glycosyltransferase family 1 protein [Actinomycetota bacterium]|nr:glycosyltransferase family 1 protein [Actinomycetota bacterium]
MRLAFDVSAILGTRTGIGHYSTILLERLVSHDADIEIQPFALTTKKDVSRIPESLRETLRRISVPARLGVTAWTRAGRPYAETYLDGVDVVHGPNFWVPPLSSASGVVTIHDMTFSLYPEMCTPQVRRYAWIIPKMLNWTRLVITPSESVRSEVAEVMGFPRDRIVVTPEGVRGSFVGVAPNQDAAREFGVDGPYVLFAGTQEPRKNLDRLIQAFAMLSDVEVQLLIVGPPGWGSVDLQAVATKLHVSSRVHFTGYVSDERLAVLMAGASAFAFPSIYEGFGLPPLEAMAAGVPVVAGRAGSLEEILGEAPFWCDPLDTSSIADALSRCLHDDAARSRAKEAGRSRAGLYSWDETARLTIEVYERAQRIR